MQGDSEQVREFGAVYAALERELDWELLGAEYCEGESGQFFDAQLRELVLDTGLRFADELAPVLAGRAPGRSLYLGAAVAELAPILVERLVLGRELAWLNLDSPETRELRRALGAVAQRRGIHLPAPSSAALDSLAPASFDHLWLVSVLTDPEQFPALHDALYERAGTELATGRGELARDTSRAEQLVRALLERAAAVCTLTTSDEELGFVEPLALQLGWRLEVPERSRLSAIVGDAVRHCGLYR